MKVLVYGAGAVGGYIGAKIADIGHDTDKVKATEEQYQKLHGCCHYDRLKDESHKH